MKNIPIGEVLKEYGYITEEQIQEALQYQKTEAGKGKRLGILVQELNFVTELQVLECLGKKLDLPLVNMADVKVDLDAVEKVPKQLAVKYNVFPFGQKNGRLQLAMSDPLNFYAQEDIRQIVDMPLDIMLAEKAVITKEIDHNYAEVGAKIAARQANISVQDAALPEIEIEDGDDDVPVIKLVNSLLARGYSANASDIHIEPFEGHTQVRMRIDGMIVDFVTLAKSLHMSLVARIKIMGNMDIAEKRIPQDGNFRTIVEGFDISIRVSVIPTIYGEKVVMRYLTSDTTIDKAGHFGMEEFAYKKLSKMLEAPNGIIYITGPTGSGKTTTLYMVLEHLAKRQVNISTIEDPVERGLPKINQMSVNVAAGLTFGVGLRALLRQDPDIIMLGETRDAETAEISVRAAITGHLVVSTLHTNDAISSIVRLEDMGLAPYLVASSLVGIVAQRLVRKVCGNCSYEVEPTPEEIAIIGPDIPVIKKGKGCHICNNTGYKGRVSIHEMVLIDKKLKRMITSGASNDEMFDYAVNEQGMKTLRQCAIDLVRRGITTPAEVIKVSYDTD
ncbi:MAG: type II secretion system protein GspE [Ruminococcus sp.]|nr:type II secretion system protein GspE [Ruminococcus sp.]MBP1566823.1 Flp pilus assembly complex ATPase component TadA [Oscillospiraceae bacterium]